MAQGSHRRKRPNNVKTYRRRDKLKAEDTVQGI